MWVGQHEVKDCDRNEGSMVMRLTCDLRLLGKTVKSMVHGKLRA